MNDIDQLPLSAFMPGNTLSSTGKPFIANAGKKNDNCKSQIQLNQVIEYLQTIFDPELPVNIYDLGLIYDIKLLENNNIKIKMSLTAPGCPVAGEMPGQVAEKVSQIPDSGLVQVELVWEPAWNITMATPEVKQKLSGN